MSKLIGIGIMVMFLAGCMGHTSDGIKETWDHMKGVVKGIVHTGLGVVEDTKDGVDTVVEEGKDAVDIKEEKK